MSQTLPTVAIVGQANVGKSSLFNRIYGSQEAVVAREAGTTRDNVIRRITLSAHGRWHMEDGTSTKRGANERFGSDAMRGRNEQRSKTHATMRRTSSEISNEAERRDGRSFWLVDTAGLKKAEDDFEASIQDQIEEAAEAADVILVVVDGTKYPDDHDILVARKALRSKKPVILAINKTDLRGNLDTGEFRRLGIGNIIRTSAEHAIGIDKLVAAIASALPPTPSSQLPAPNDTLRVALIGRPNVGKSNLFNRLAGKQQAIVANVAGTTRDVNRVGLRYEGRDVELLDTAGIRRAGRQEVGIEKFSVLRTLQAIEEADICCLLMDAGEHSTQLDQKLAGMIKEAGKGLIIIVSKWDSIDKDPKTADDIAARITHEFAFVPWASLIFTSAVTGQNVTKILELSYEIDKRRRQQFKTSELNRILSDCVRKHPPAGLKNTFPKLRYMVQTDQAPPWFVVFGSNLKLLHWSYKRYLERQLRDNYDLTGTPIMFSFRQEQK